MKRPTNKGWLNLLLSLEKFARNFLQTIINQTIVSYPSISWVYYEMLVKISKSAISTSNLIKSNWAEVYAGSNIMEFKRLKARCLEDILGIHCNRRIFAWWLFRTFLQTLFAMSSSSTSLRPRYFTIIATKSGLTAVAGNLFRGESSLRHHLKELYDYISDRFSTDSVLNARQLIMFDVYNKPIKARFEEEWESLLAVEKWCV